MLNRRQARIRAMQSLYSYEKSKGANFLIAQDLISAYFSPDLNSMEKKDRNKLAGLAKLSQSLFEDEIKLNVSDPDPASIPNEVNTALQKARVSYKNANRIDFLNFKKQVLVDAESTYDIYLLILNLLVELYKKPNSVLNKNKALKALAESQELSYNSAKRAVTLADDAVFVNKLYNEGVKGNPHVLEYLAITNKTSENDLNIVKYIIKNVVLRQEESQSFFEKKHIYWLVDREVLRTMLFHSFDDFVQNGKVEIEVLDSRWAETKDFLNVLFSETIERNNELLGIISPYLKNWDIERINETDLILLKMAVTELMLFNSIPIKVTINEIIEISKDFSSEKSKVFINGILDSIVKELQSSGKIKKTGRGMLDNK